jgi:hypothetical protein
MTRIDGESKRKLREMGVTSLFDALETQDDTLTLGMPFEERIKLLVDDAHATFTHVKVEGLIRRAGLRYPNADLRKLDLVEQRGFDRGIIAQLGTCTYLGSALAKQACQHRYRAHYIRIPNLEEAQEEKGKVPHTVRMFPGDIWAQYKGNATGDATHIVAPGRPNPTDPTMTRGNADPQSGRYRRQGNHDFGS